MVLLAFYRLLYNFNSNLFLGFSSWIYIDKSCRLVRESWLVFFISYIPCLLINSVFILINYNSLNNLSAINLIPVLAVKVAIIFYFIKSYENMISNYLIIILLVSI